MHESKLIEESVRVELDESAKWLSRDSQHIFVLTVDSEVYTSCCGLFEERYIKVKLVDSYNPSEAVIIVTDPLIMATREAVELIRSNGNKLIISADSNGGLYTNISEFHSL